MVWSLISQIPILIILVGVMALAISVSNFALNLGDNFLSLFSVTEAFWMGVLYTVVGAAILLWSRAGLKLRRRIALLIIGVGVIGAIVAVVAGALSGVTHLSVFNLAQILQLAAVYIVVGVLLLLAFGSREDLPPAPEPAPMATPTTKTSTSDHKAVYAPADPPSLRPAAQMVRPKTQPIRYIPPAKTTPEPTSAATAMPPAPAAMPPMPPSLSPAASAMPLAPVTTPKPHTPDDLLIIEGIGPKILDALKKAGVTTFTQLAQMSPDDIERVVKAQGVRMVGDAETWPRQAQYLVDGDAVGFEAYIKKLVAGRDPDKT